MTARKERHDQHARKGAGRLLHAIPQPGDGETINETLRFHGVAKSDGPYPADGSDENNTFSRFSPSVDFSIVVANPALFGKFSSGDTYYVDFTPAA